MGMRKNQVKYFLLVIICVSFLLSCGVSETPMMEATNYGGVAPQKVYQPEYYVYKNGRYKFVKGHYRKVYNRKIFRKRSLEGYGSKGDYRAVR